MSAYSDRIVADGASHYWRLNETSGTSAIDIIGGATGTISGGVTLGQAGALADGNTAMTFNGTDGKIVTAAAVTLPVVMTLELWLKVGAGVSGERTLVSTRTGAVGTLWYLLPSGTVSVYSTNGILTGTRVLKDGQWHHVVWAFDAGSCALYTDGTLDTAAVCGRVLHAGAMAMAWDEVNPIWLDGALDEVAIYPRTLTAPEIAAHYALATTPVLTIGLPQEALMRGFTHGFAITPSDSVTVTKPVQAVWVGGPGNLAVILANETVAVTFTGVAAGILDVVPKRVMATGTTATGLIGLSE